MATNILLEAAIECALRGWLVFPIYHFRGPGVIPCACGRSDCSQIAKHPQTANGFLDGTTDEEIISAWWSRWRNANVGIATGAASGIVVIDIDSRHGGFGTLSDLERANGPIEDTVRAVTGGGGEHLYFRHPGGYVANDSMGKKIGGGIDVRGDGGYVVAPPSNHKSGALYGWKSGYSPDDVELAPLPDWLAVLVVEHPEPQLKAPAREREFKQGTAEFWLQKALQQAAPGSRNDCGFWLACQLRDAGVNQADAELTLREFASLVPQADEPFREKEVIASVRSAYSVGARSPAKGAVSRAADRIIISKPKVVAAVPCNGAASELSDFLTEVIAGRIFNVPFPWTAITNLTQALLPGSIMSLCGDPGVGKTFWTLQCLQFWKGNDYRPRVFFIEKDRRFHSQRLLAQLEGNGGFVDLDWVKRNSDAVMAAMERNREYIDDLGGCIASRVGGRITLNDLVKWMEKQAEENTRVMVIDPITAANAGAERWVADDDFVDAAAQIMLSAKASLILLTHPKKANIKGQASGHDMALGAAYNRFVDTVAWLRRPTKPRRVRVMTQHGPTTLIPDIFCHLQKTRDGKGAGLEIALSFKGNALQFKEEGIVEKDLPINESEDE